MKQQWVSQSLRLRMLCIVREHVLWFLSPRIWFATNAVRQLFSILRLHRLHRGHQYLQWGSCGDGLATFIWQISRVGLVKLFERECWRRERTWKKGCFHDKRSAGITICPCSCASDHYRGLYSTGPWSALSTFVACVVSKRFPKPCTIITFLPADSEDGKIFIFCIFFAFFLHCLLAFFLHLAFFLAFLFAFFLHLAFFGIWNCPWQKTAKCKKNANKMPKNCQMQKKCKNNAKKLPNAKKMQKKMQKKCKQKCKKNAKCKKKAKKKQKKCKNTNENAKPESLKNAKKMHPECKNNYFAISSFCWPGKVIIVLS